MSSKKELQAEIENMEAEMNKLLEGLDKLNNMNRALSADIKQRDKMLGKKRAQFDKQYRYIQMQKQTLHKIIANIEQDKGLGNMKDDIVELVRSTNELTKTIKGSK